MFEGIKERFLGIKQYLKNLGNNQAVLEDLDTASFIGTLLPIPGYKEAASIVNKIISNKALKLKFDEVWKQLVTHDNRIAKSENDLVRLQEMAKAVESSGSLKAFVEGLVKECVQDVDGLSTEFEVDTKRYSFQSLLNAIIQADLATISAEDHSHNVIKDTEVQAKKTVLRAHDHSSNVVDGTKFKGKKGSVEMNRVKQEGHVEVSDAKVTYKGPSSLQTGKFYQGVNEKGDFVIGVRPVPRFNLDCPKCGARVNVTEDDLHRLRAAGRLICSSCGHSGPVPTL